MPKRKITVELGEGVIDLNDGGSRRRYWVNVRENFTGERLEHFTDILHYYFLTLRILIDVTHVHVTDIHENIQIAILKPTLKCFFRTMSGEMIT